MRRGFFRNPLRYDAHSNEEYSEREIQAELRRAGSIDPDLAAAGLVPPSGDLLNVASELIWGSEDPTQLLTLLETWISPLAPEKGREVLSDFLSSLEPYVATTGLFGNPDEIEKSGLEALATIGEGDLLRGRRFYQFALAMADCGTRGGEFIPRDVAPALPKASLRSLGHCVSPMNGASWDWRRARLRLIVRSARRDRNSSPLRTSKYPRPSDGRSRLAVANVKKGSSGEDPSFPITLQPFALCSAPATPRRCTLPSAQRRPSVSFAQRDLPRRAPGPRSKEPQCDIQRVATGTRCRHRRGSFG